MWPPPTGLGWKAVVADRDSSQKHVWRARIVLLAVAGCGTAEIMRRTAKAKTAVWRWQERFMRAGVDGLCCGTRPGRPASPRWRRKSLSGFFR